MKDEMIRWGAMRYFQVSCFLGVMILILPTCGYRFSRGGDLPGGIKRVSVGVIENKSAETGVESIIINAIAYEFIRNGKILSFQRGAADAVLSGTVQSVTTQSVSRQTVHSSLERQVTVTVSLEMTDPKGKVIWRAPRLSEYEAYEVADDKGTTEQNKRAAILKLSRRMAEKVYGQMTENF